MNQSNRAAPFARRPLPIRSARPNGRRPGPRLRPHPQLAAAGGGRDGAASGGGSGMSGHTDRERREWRHRGRAARPTGRTAGRFRRDRPIRPGAAGQRANGRRRRQVTPRMTCASLRPPAAPMGRQRHRHQARHQTAGAQMAAVADRTADAGRTGAPAVGQAAAVGVVNGSGDFRFFDIDAPKDENGQAPAAGPRIRAGGRARGSRSARRLPMVVPERQRRGLGLRRPLCGTAARHAVGRRRHRQRRRPRRAGVRPSGAALEQRPDGHPRRAS